VSPKGILYNTGINWGDQSGKKDILVWRLFHQIKKGFALKFTTANHQRHFGCHQLQDCDWGKKIAGADQWLGLSRDEKPFELHIEPEYSIELVEWSAQGNHQRIQQVQPWNNCIQVDAAPVAVSWQCQCAELKH
jgi:hypothetical protein